MHSLARLPLTETTLRREAEAAWPPAAGEPVTVCSLTGVWADRAADGGLDWQPHPPDRLRSILVDLGSDSAGVRHLAALGSLRGSATRSGAGGAPCRSRTACWNCAVTPNTYPPGTRRP